VGEDPLPCGDEARVVWRQAHEFAGEVAFYAERNVPWATRVETPTPVLVLDAEDLVEGPLEAAWITAIEKLMKENIICLEHRVGFELAAPISIRMLDREQIILGPRDGRPEILSLWRRRSRFCSLGDSASLRENHVVERTSGSVRTLKK